MSGSWKLKWGLELSRNSRAKSIIFTSIVKEQRFRLEIITHQSKYTPITYYWTVPLIWQLISHWELDKFKTCLNKSFRTSKILTLFYQQFSNLLISQRDMSGPRLGALSNNRWSGDIECGLNWNQSTSRSWSRIYACSSLPATYV